MSERVAREPSPVRSGVVHTALSLAVFTGVAALAGTVIHLFGDASAASPARQIALFAPNDGQQPHLKTRFASTDGNVRTVVGAGERQTAYAGQDETTAENASSPSLGVDYDKDGTARVVKASASAGDADMVRINGVSVKAGRSWQETRELKSLARAPITTVSERTSLGYLPKISDDGRTPAGTYARPFANPENRPTVSIVVGGLGINWRHTKSAIEELPPEITLSFAPTTGNLQNWIDQARAAGHEVLIELPMEPYDFGREAPSANTLYTSNDSDEMNRRLKHLLSRGTGYFGVTNYQGSKFATDPTATAAFADALKARGVAFIEDGTLSSSSSFTRAADKTGLRFRQSDTVIDARPDGSEIETKLLELETIALEGGHSLGTGMAYPITIDILKEWTDSLEEKGILLAPASSVTKAARPAPETVDTADISDETGGQAGG
ncbi:divergent polysaccharide deacetylase family protein [Henriciella aquimarina]|uniref:divergent polysaccharide deacetylase family protein n=1 Tax=Henriciella aquimarina TaxID=545261 RepID=UPI000A005ECE|nr:divergent polysaccharide deacetylase family protein [Henriciella aquimarina]